MTRLLKKFSIPTLIGLSITLILPFYLTFSPRMEKLISDPLWAVGFVSLQWIIVIAFILLILFWEKKPLSTIGFRRPKWSDLLLGFLGFVVGLLSFLIGDFLITLFKLRLETAVIDVTAIPWYLRLILPVLAGVKEEIFKAYIIERLGNLTHSLYFAALVSLVIFILSHHVTLAGFISFAPWTIVITGLYLWKRNINICIIMHILYDGFLAWAPIFFGG